MKTAWKWIAGVGSALAAILAFVLYRKYVDDHVNTLKDALVVSKAETKIVALETEREALQGSIDDRGEEIAIVEDQLVANKVAIVEARTGVAPLDEAGVLAEYRKLGYL